MKYEIHGTTLQTLDIFLDRGESLFTEFGGMAWMTEAKGFFWRR